MELAFHPLSFASILLKSPFLAGLGERPKREQGRSKEEIGNEGIAEKEPGWREAGQTCRERHPQTVEAAWIRRHGEPANGVGDEVKENPSRKETGEYARQGVNRTSGHSTSDGNDEGQGNPCRCLAEPECGIAEKRRQQ